MGISPPSDIIMDVIGAAGRTTGLADLAVAGGRPPTPGVGPVSIGRLPKAVGAVTAGKWKGHLQAVRSSSDVAAPVPPAGRANTQPKANADIPLRREMAKLEGVLLQTMLQGIMSAPEKGPFATGLSGSYWKSFLLQAIAEQVAERGGIGIADAALSLRHRFERRFLSHVFPAIADNHEGET